MSVDLQTNLKHKTINRWALFWLVSIPMSLIMVIEMMGTDLTTAAGVSAMIGFSVRWAVPFIYLVVAASALQSLLPGPLPMWLLRNRKYVGLCFAVAMAWQGLFIFLMSNFHRDYYFDEIYYLRDELEGSTGYIFLTAMVLTSFQFGRKYLNQAQWKLLHTSGIYFLWAYPFSVYWWNLSYYENPTPIDHVYYCGGFLAFALRIAAWGKKRRDSNRSAPRGTSFVHKLLGGTIIAFGILVAATGRRWQEAVSELLTTPNWSANLELWVPYWPFEPFLSLFIIGFGTMLATRTDGLATGVHSAPETG